MDKYLISLKRSFSNSATTYDTVSFAQQDTAQQLLLLAQNAPIPSSILDIGTGTGTLLPFIQAYYPNANTHAMDISLRMLLQTKEKYPHIPLFCADAQETILPYYTMYMSHFAFQWFTDLFASIASFWKNTQSLVFTCLLENTFQEWWHLCHKHSIPSSSLYRYPSFPSLSHFLSTLDNAHLHIQEEYYPLNFETALHFLRYLKLLGASIPQATQHSFLRTICSSNTPFTTHYHIAYVVLWRK